MKRAEGKWHVFGEGGIAFSGEFLQVSGEVMGPGGKAYGQVRNSFGFVSIALNPDGDGPKFHKKLFR